jgi:hypothetical protein
MNSKYAQPFELRDDMFRREIAVAALDLERMMYRYIHTWHGLNHDLAQ